MGLWSRIKNSSDATAPPPPEWTPAPEIPYRFGKYHEAPHAEYEAAEAYCAQHPIRPPGLLPAYLVDTIHQVRSNAWKIQVPQSSRFVGRVDNEPVDGCNLVKVETDHPCQDTCLFTDLPIMMGLYDVSSVQKGVYYEVVVDEMDGTIAIGTACHPYPPWRLPGWHRQSAALHLDDLRKFFEDSDGGRDYTDQITHISPTDVIGCGYEFATNALFYTYNGTRLPNAFAGIYSPRRDFDVYAAIGVSGHCKLRVNFGGNLFAWEVASQEGWQAHSHVGLLNADIIKEEAPPPY